MTRQDTGATVEGVAPGMEPGAVIELGHPFHTGMPGDPSHPPYLFTPWGRHGDCLQDDGYGGTSDLIVMSGHSGTHIDAVGHSSDGGVLYGGHSARNSQGARGLTVHGAESIPPIIRPALLIDVADHLGVERLAPAAPIDADLLAAASPRSPAAGDCVLIRTGQGALWHDRARYLSELDGTPGITARAAEWLATADVCLVGADTALVEQACPGDDALPVHRLLLAHRGIFLVENMNLEDLAARQIREFVFICLPLRLVGASGSPIRPVAVTPPSN